MNSKLLQPLKDFSVTFIIIFIICSTLINAQEVVDLNGKQFIKSGGEWFQLYSGKRFKVDKKVITVKFKSSYTPNEIVKLNTQFNVKVLRENILGFIDVEIPSSADPIEMVKAYLNNSLVEIAEVNTYGEHLGTPNDLYFANQWYLYQISDADIDVTEAWNIESGKPSQVISIVDSGTDWTHEDLGFGTDSYQNIWLNPGEDAWSDPNDPSTGNGIDDDYNGYIDD